MWWMSVGWMVGWLVGCCRWLLLVVVGVVLCWLLVGVWLVARWLCIDFSLVAHWFVHLRVLVVHVGCVCVRCVVVVCCVVGCVSLLVVFGCCWWWLMVVGVVVRTLESTRAQCMHAPNSGLPDTSGQVPGVCATRPRPDGGGPPAVFLCTGLQKKKNDDNNSSNDPSTSRLCPRQCRLQKQGHLHPSTLQRTCEQAPPTRTAPSADTRLVKQQSQGPHTTRLVLHDHQVLSTSQGSPTLWMTSSSFICSFCEK